MDINPCPFCGGTPKLIQRTHPAIAHVALAWVVQCTGCTAETCSEHRQWSIDYWNRRAQPSAPVQPEIRDYIAITNKHIDAADEIILYIKDCKSEFIECTPLASILAKRFREGEIV